MEINKRNVRTWSMVGARGAFGMVIGELAQERDDFMVLSADLGGSSGLKRFMETHPDRFIDVGIAEQNMIGIAAGIAREGIPVFATSFAPFISLRSGEQMRMDAGYMHLNVKAVGLGSGLSTGFLGNSHYGLEDAAVMRAIPNITVVSPADGAEIAKATAAALDHDGPMYIRLTGAANNPVVYSENYEFQIGKAIRLQEGGDVAILATGTMVYESLQAAKCLEEHGISTAVLDVHTLKPLDEEPIREYSGRVKLLVTVEEHVKTGGLGSAVAAACCPMRRHAPQMIIGLPDRFGKAAEYRSLLTCYGLTGSQIADQIRAGLSEL